MLKAVYLFVVDHGYAWSCLVALCVCLAARISLVAYLHDETHYLYSPYSWTTIVCAQMIKLLVLLPVRYFIGGGQVWHVHVTSALTVATMNVIIRQCLLLSFLALTPLTIARSLQLITLSTSALSTALYAHNRSVGQWSALLLLTVGSIMVVTPNIIAMPSALEDSQTVDLLSLPTGLAIVGVTVVITSYQRVFTANWMHDVTVIDAGIQLSLLELMLGVSGALWSHQSLIVNISSFTSAMWLLVFVQAAIGTLSIAVLKHSNVDAFSFTQSIALCLHIPFDLLSLDDSTPLSMNHAYGTVNIIIATFNYMYKKAVMTADNSSALGTQMVIMRRTEVAESYVRKPTSRLSVFVTCMTIVAMSMWLICASVVDRRFAVMIFPPAAQPMELSLTPLPLAYLNQQSQLSTFRPFTPLSVTVTSPIDIMPLRILLIQSHNALHRMLSQELSSLISRSRCYCWLQSYTYALNIGDDIVDYARRTPHFSLQWANSSIPNGYWYRAIQLEAALTDAQSFLGNSTITQYPTTLNNPRGHLQTFQFDWLLYLDLDAIVMNTSWPIQDLIQSFEVRHNTSCFFVAQDDSEELNSGAFVVRQSSDALQFVRMWLNEWATRQSNAWVLDQGPLMSTVLRWYHMHDPQRYPLDEDGCWNEKDQFKKNECAFRVLSEDWGLPLGHRSRFGVCLLSPEDAAERFSSHRIHSFAKGKMNGNDDWSLHAHSVEEKYRLYVSAALNKKLPLLLTENAITIDAPVFHDENCPFI